MGSSLRNSIVSETLNHMAYLAASWPFVKQRVRTETVNLPTIIDIHFFLIFQLFRFSDAQTLVTKYSSSGILFPAEIRNP
jgi:hypothetical protein